jgi:hypothetical protein
MKISSRPRRTAELLAATVAVALVLAAGPLWATPATAESTTAIETTAIETTAVETTAIATTALQQAVDSSVASASAAGIEQSITVVDRETGARLASSGGSTQYLSESIVKLFTVAYYEVQAGGEPDDSMVQTLRTMIVNSDDDIESSLWNVDIVPSMAARYGLADTSNGPRTGPHDWGWELITADDEAKFLYEVLNDPVVAPLLLDAMAGTARTGADGSDQYFGMNTLSGDHGSKQGWTDADAGSTEPAEIHSVGWTTKYFVAILQTADGPYFEEMKGSATAAAQAVFTAEALPPNGTAPDSPGTPADETPAAQSTESTATGDAPSQSPTEAASAAPLTETASTAATPVPSGGLAPLLSVLRHDFDLLIADLTELIEGWR